MMKILTLRLPNNILPALALAFVLLLAACGPGIPEAEPGVNWCYKFNFASSNYGFSNPQGFYAPTYGFFSNPESGLLSFSYSHNQIVQPTLVIVRASRVTSGAIDVTANAIAFGVGISIDQTIPDVAEDYLEIAFTPELGDAGSTLNLSLQATGQVLIEEIEIRGEYVNPFPENSCAPVTTPTSGPTATNTQGPTPIVPTRTPSPTPSLTPSNTPTNTPSFTPTGSQTATPICEYRTLEIDFDANNTGYTIPDSEGTVTSYGGAYGNALLGSVLYINQRIATAEITLPASATTVETVRFDVERNAGGADYIFTPSGSAVRQNIMWGSASWYTLEWTALAYNVAANSGKIRVAAHNNQNTGSALTYLDNIEIIYLDCSLTPTPTGTATRTPTATRTGTAQPTATRTPVGLPTLRGSGTPVVITNTPGPTNTPAPTNTPLPTRTFVPFPTVYPTPDPGDPPEEQEDRGEINILNAINDFFSWVVNSAGNFLDFLGALVAFIIATIANFIALIGNVLAAITGFFTLLGALVNDVITIVRLMAEIVQHMLAILGDYIGQFLQLSYNIFDAWFSTPPAAIPYLPQCVSNPTEWEICAVWYVFQHTVFAGPLGALIIPIALGVVNLVLVLMFIRWLRNLLNKGEDVT